MVSKPRDSKDEGVVSELCNESRHLLPVPVDVQAYLGPVGDVSRVDGSTAVNLEAAGVPVGMQWEVVLLRKVLVDKGKTGGPAVDQGVGIQVARRVFNSALDDQMVTIKLRD